MLQIELNMYQAVAVAALVLLLGRFLVSKIPFLTKILYSLSRLSAALLAEELHMLPSNRVVTDSKTI